MRRTGVLGMHGRERPAGRLGRRFAVTLIAVLSLLLSQVSLTGATGTPWQGRQAPCERMGIHSVLAQDGKAVEATADHNGTTPLCSSMAVGGECLGTCLGLVPLAVSVPASESLMPTLLAEAAQQARLVSPLRRPPKLL